MFTSKICRNGTGHKRGFVFRSSSLPDYLIMHFRTDFFLEVNGQIRYGKAGDWVIHRPGSCVAHGPRSQRESFVNDWLFFSAGTEDEALLLQLPYDIPISVADESVFPQAISEILSEQIRNDPFSPQLISNRIYQLLSVLCRTPMPDSNGSNALFLKFQDLRAHILKHSNQSWTLGQMAALSGYSVSRFSELYKQFFGKSPVDDLLDERLKLAKHLLALKTYSMSEVATLCGFSSLHYFSGFFRKRTGYAPTNY